MKKITVTKSFLPPLPEYIKKIEAIWETGQLTTFGPMTRELMQKLANRFDIAHLLFVSNGTLALQIALKTLDIKGEVITTPFSYVATTSAIVWENAIPVFVDIDPNTLNIDPDKIEEKITSQTSAILATHVFGNPCAVDKISAIAKKHNLKIIYDAAHAFDVGIGSKSILKYGDISILSFHATKVFHTTEGGGIATNQKSLFDKALQHSNFGHNGANVFERLGINGKNCEFHAAMGLLNLKYIDKIIAERKERNDLYDALFSDCYKNGKLETQFFEPNVKRNYNYYPIILPTEKILENILKKLKEKNIYPRRYFYPSLNKLPYLTKSYSVSLSESISNRILCLPLYESLEKHYLNLISSIVKKCL